MNRESKFLAVILAVLTLGVLLTVVMILVVAARQQENIDPASAEDGFASLLTPTEPGAESRIAYVADRFDELGFSAIYVTGADGSDRQQLVRSEDGMCMFPSWSPDGQKIAYSMHTPSEDGEFWDGNDLYEVWVAPLDGSAHTRISDAIPSIHVIRPVTWSPDGKRLAFLAWVAEDENDTLFVVWADNGKVEYRIPLDFWAIEMMLWSPGGDELLFIPETDTTKMTIHLLSLDDMRITPLYEVNMLDSWGLGTPMDWSPDGTEFAIANPLALEVSITSPDGELYQSIQVPDGFPVEVVWSPNGAYIAVSASSRMLDAGDTSDMTIHILDAETGGIIATLDEEEEMMMTLLNWSSDSKRVLFTTMFETPQGWLSTDSLWIYDVTSGALERLDTGGEDGQVDEMGVWSP